MSHPLLETLVEHPLLSAEQLGVLYAAHPNTVRGELKKLGQEGLVARINPRSPILETRSVFYPTSKGIREIAISSTDMLVLSSRRLIELWLVLERVYLVRNLLLMLERPYAVENWNVEVQEQYAWRNPLRTLKIHGKGIAHVNGSSIPFVIEWDTRILPLERQHLARWVEWNWAIRLSNSQIPRPVFLVLASDGSSLERYYAELRAAAFARNLPTPQTFITTKADVFRDGPTAPIWYFAETGKKTTLFGGVNAVTAQAPAMPFTGSPSSKGTLVKRTLNLSQIQFNPAKSTTLSSLASLKRDLSPQAKSVLNEIGAHPMLSNKELAELLRAAPKRVQVAIAQLVHSKLVQAEVVAQETRSVLTDIGVAYLAAVNGFARGARKYANARGWKRGTTALVRHWEHTRTENEFFMQVMREVRKSNARFVWQSELESRLYYAARGRRWSYLPDGGGIYEGNGTTIQFALEMDRGTVSRKRWYARLAQYHAFMDSARLHPTARDEFRLLVITTSWTRADNLRRVALASARMRQSRVLPMWITTLDSVQVRGLGERIWRDVRDWLNCRLFDDSSRAQSQSYR